MRPKTHENRVSYLLLSAVQAQSAENYLTLPPIPIRDMDGHI